MQSTNPASMDNLDILFRSVALVKILKNHEQCYMVEDAWLHLGKPFLGNECEEAMVIRGRLLKCGG